MAHQRFPALLLPFLYKSLSQNSVGGELSTTSGFGAALFKLIFAVIKLLN